MRRILPSRRKSVEVPTPKPVASDVERVSRRAYANSNVNVKHDVERLSRRIYANSNVNVKHDVRTLTA